MEDTPITQPVGDAPKKRAPRKPVKTSSLHVRYANVKGIDVTRAAKLNRSYMRSNWDALVKVWPDLRKSQKVNRDGNRWPETCPAHVADMIVKRAIPASRAK